MRIRFGGFCELRRRLRASSRVRKFMLSVALSIAALTCCSAAPASPTSCQSPANAFQFWAACQLGEGDAAPLRQNHSPRLNAHIIDIPPDLTKLAGIEPARHIQS